MRIRYFGDLHLEFTHYSPASLPSVGEDIVVLAGDIGIGTKGIEWAQRAIPDRPVLYVMGNHEFYRQDWHELLDDARFCAHGSNVHFLENDSVTLGGIRFLGCSLWTDFAFWGEGRRASAMLEAERVMNDYRLIDNGKSGGGLLARHTVERHVESRRWLEDQLKVDVPTVVVTHMAPTAHLLNPAYEGGLLNAAFHNRLDHLVGPPVRAWIFGHTHCSGQAFVNGVQILSNQRGYPHERMAFDWNAMVELEDPKP